jgi:translation initiation factor 1
MSKKILSGNGWSFEPSGGAAAAETVSLSDAEQKAKLKLEKRNKGEECTVVSGFVLSAADRKTLCTTLKKTCGSGGSDTDAGIEIQGDHRDKIRALLTEKGWTVR